MSIIKLLFSPRTVQVVLHDSEPWRMLPGMGQTKYEWPLSGFDGYTVRRASVAFWGEHECPSDVMMWVQTPGERRFFFYYRPDMPDWSLNVGRDMTPELRNEPANGTWSVVIFDDIAGDGGFAGAVALSLTLHNPLGLAFWKRGRLTPVVSEKVCSTEQKAGTGTKRSGSAKTVR